MTFTQKSDGQDLTRQFLLQENARGLVEDICSTCEDDAEATSTQQTKAAGKRRKPFYITEVS
ncbi:hypothetical protein [Paenibacillus aquistagni]|uniref:hypothetical protein n=1 Tax=Paenibacillus aquistagni TaxID=1852522 RepID=UPI00145BF348|nr:hypothetical protein [Paenibacillus aquistagni]NMM53434.1 hypothetical protein [Paenibacillus aquistagni]